MTRMSRREFLRRGVAAGATGAAVLALGKEVLAASPGAVAKGSVIDLTLCDGCSGNAVPFCVSACRSKNEKRFPM